MKWWFSRDIRYWLFTNRITQWRCSNARAKENIICQVLYACAYIRVCVCVFWLKKNKSENEWKSRGWFNRNLITPALLSVGELPEMSVTVLNSRWWITTTESRVIIVMRLRGNARVLLKTKNICMYVYVHSETQPAEHKFRSHVEMRKARFFE